MSPRYSECMSTLNSEALLQQTDIEEIAERGGAIYEGIKQEFEPKHLGKFLAIEIASGKTYLGDASSEAVEQARKAHPGTVFYVVKIGYSAAEALANMGLYAHGLHQT